MTPSIFRTGAALGLGAVLFTACKPNLTADAPSAGSANFSSYVAIGNSLTAGYADGSLYRSGQQNSYPSILARQFASVGFTGDFKQPLLPGESGWPDPKRVLASVNGSFAPVPYAGSRDTAGSSTVVTEPQNNTGIPGVRAVDFLLPAGLYGAFNPYMKRTINNPSGSVLANVTAKPATFYTVWVGSNDVLGYATAGGTGNVGTATNLPVPSGDISPLSLFAVSYDSIINRVVRNGAKGVLINVPDVTSIPFFTTVPYNALNPAANPAYKAQIPALNAAFSSLNLVFSALNAADRRIVFDSTQPSGLLIRDVALTNLSSQITQALSGAGVPAQQAALYGQLYGQVRQARSTDLVLLTTASVIGTTNTNATVGGNAVPDPLRTWGITYPLDNSFVLTSAEVANVSSFTNQYNSYIRQKASQIGWALWDANTYLKTLQAGITFNGVNYNALFVSGGAFSLDGIHLTPRGYALAANEIIRAINATYNASVPTVDANQYSGVRFP